MPRLEHTSVPAWAVATGGPGGAPARPVAPVATSPGSSYLLVGVGAAAADRVADWGERVGGPDVPVARILGPDLAAVTRPFADALAAASVGVRVRLAGPVAACLTLRAQGLQAGLEDDELLVVATDTGPIDLWCVHCAATTPVDAAIGDVVACGACERNLLVYHHVSRLTGRFLGYQIDAEEVA